MSKTIVLPTCSAPGYTVFKCNDCSFSFDSDFVSPSSHTIVKTVVAPTCSAGGYTLNECSDCNYSYTSDLTGMAEHTISSKTVAPTCYSTGYTLEECSKCSYTSKTTPSQTLSHDLKATVVEPTCEKEGYTSYSCKNCDFSYTADHLSALTHVFESVVTEPTCTKQGYTTKTCSVCSHTVITDYTNPTGHSYTTQKKRATSSADGYTLHTCSNCDYSYKTDYQYSYSIFTGAYAQSNKPLAKGIDVSAWNGTLDWNAIKAAGIDFAIIRAYASEGKDTRFETNYYAAHNAGIDLGAYYYVEAKSVEEILECAEKLKEVLEGKKFEYPIYLDIEKDSLGAELGRELLTEMCVAFIENLQADGYFAALYTNNNWLENFYDKELVTERYDIWYARYLSADNINSPEWNIERYGTTMGIWQYTNEGIINGGNCAFDLNISYKDYPTIIKRYHYNGY